MEQQTERSGAAKAFAVVGFLALIIFFVWLAVQVVSLIPGAFSSLASLADSVYQGGKEETITIATGSSIVSSGESFTVNWSVVKRSGSYTFSYACEDGVAIEIRHPGNTITPVPCDEVVDLGSDISSLEIIARAEKKRFTDVTYTIEFVPDDIERDIISKDAIFTIVNANIPQSGPVVVETPTEPTEEPETPTTPTTPVKPTTPTPGKPTVITTPIYKIPVSDPNGKVDLAVKFLAVGMLTSNNVFVPTGTIDNDTRGAFQFEVKNIGTKTSDDWTFEATLPSGTDFESREQDGLKPNERSVITLGFDHIGDLGTARIEVTVDAKNDVNSKNDGFSWLVNVVN